MNEARLTEIALFSISLSHQEKARNLCGGAGRIFDRWEAGRNGIRRPRRFADTCRQAGRSSLRIWRNSQSCPLETAVCDREESKLPGGILRKDRASTHQCEVSRVPMFYGIVCIDTS